MEEVVRRCDRLIGTKGKRCLERIPDDTPTSFTYEGVTYKADLCAKHQADFLRSIEDFLHIAEPVSARNGGAIRKAMRGKKSGDPYTTKDVREWLKAQGRSDIPPSGRLPKSAFEEYEAAHGT